MNIHTDEPVSSWSGALRRWWPSLIALALSLVVAGLQRPFEHDDPPLWVLPLLGVIYLAFGAMRGTLRRPGVLALQVGVLVALVVLTVVALLVAPPVARYIVAFGWLAHAFWDLAHHRGIAKHASVGTVPRWYAEACAIVDLVIGVALLAA